MENINVNKIHQQSLSPLERFAKFITEKVGTMGFFIIIFVWTAFWLLWNIFGPEDTRFDPYPAFVTWLFISNMIQIFLMPLIMIGQNLEARHSELRADMHYKADIKADKSVAEIKAIMAEQTKTLNEISDKLQK